MPHGKRTPPTRKSEEILDKLADLRERLNTTAGKEKAFSAVEAYDGMVKMSEHGRDCQYAERFLLLFFENDYNEVRRMIGELYGLMYNDNPDAAP